MLILQTLTVAADARLRHRAAHQASHRRQLEVEAGLALSRARALQKKGWLTSRWEPSPTGRQARYYTITAAGRKQLGEETHRLRSRHLGHRARPRARLILNHLLRRSCRSSTLSATVFACCFTPTRMVVSSSVRSNIISISRARKTARRRAIRSTPQDVRRRAMREFETSHTPPRSAASRPAFPVFDALRQDVQFVFRVLRRPGVRDCHSRHPLFCVRAATSIFSHRATSCSFARSRFRTQSASSRTRKRSPKLKTIPSWSAQWKIGFSLPGFRDWRAIQNIPSTISRTGTTARASLVALMLPKKSESSTASASMLAVLGVRPELGRGSGDEDQLGGMPVALRDDDAWMARWRAIRKCIGAGAYGLTACRTRSVGALPPGTEIERNITPTSYWVPAATDADLYDRGN